MTEDDEAIHVNFTDIDTSPRTFRLLPGGKYIAEVTDFTRDTAGESAKNPGAPIIGWEFTIESTEDGETEITSRLRDPKTKVVEDVTIKVEGRRVFDNMVVVKESFWRLGQFLEACWFDTSGDVELYPEEVMGCRLILEIGQQRASKNKTTGEEYRARNKIITFLPLESERPSTAEPEPVATTNGDTKATTKGDKEEAKV